MHGLFFGSLFWGILISLIGISIILKYVLNIDIPLGRIFFGIILVLIGIKIILGNSNRNYSSKSVKVNRCYENGECNIIFSSGMIDLSNYKNGKKLPEEINVVFGSGTILVPENMSLEIKTTTVFGSTEFPNHSYNGFAEDSFTIKGIDNTPIHRLETNAIFGKLIIDVIKTKINDNNTEQDSTNNIGKNSF